MKAIKDIIMNFINSHRLTRFVVIIILLLVFGYIICLHFKTSVTEPRVTVGYTGINGQLQQCEGDVIEDIPRDKIVLNNINNCNNSKGGQTLIINWSNIRTIEYQERSVYQQEANFFTLVTNNIENNLLAVIGTIAAFISFTLGLDQYIEGQKWKRAEFVAQEVKEFEQNNTMQNVFKLIDYGERKINLSMDSNLKEDEYFFINRYIQYRAMLPDLVKKKYYPKTINKLDRLDRLDKENVPGFTKTEANIRDAYDNFFTYLTKFGHYMDTNLININECKPYLDYWIKSLATIGEGYNHEDDRIWQYILFAYINDYNFLTVIKLFEHFGYNIKIDLNSLSDDITDSKSTSQKISKTLFQELEKKDTKLANRLKLFFSNKKENFNENAKKRDYFTRVNNQSKYTLNFLCADNSECSIEPNTENKEIDVEVLISYSQGKDCTPIWRKINCFGTIIFSECSCNPSCNVFCLKSAKVKNDTSNNENFLSRELSDQEQKWIKVSLKGETQSSYLENIKVK